MINALGNPQTLLLLGGSSDIALAIAREYAERTFGLRVVLAARQSDRREAAARELQCLDCHVETVDLDARQPEDHAQIIKTAAAHTDIDIAVVAYGMLGDNELASRDIQAGVELAEVNFVGPVASGIALAEQIRHQGHGVIVALSSVAGERPRRSNFVYGATKAGFDAFYTGLGESLREHGGRVLVVRPGFVNTKMTQGLSPAPLAAQPADVAAAVVEAVAAGREQIWVPAQMRVVISVLRHLPRPIFRRLPI